MRNAAREGRRGQHVFGIMRFKSQTRHRIMRKKSSCESLDFVKLLDSHLPVYGREIVLWNAGLRLLVSISCLGRAGVDAECVYVALHQFRKRAVDQSMALNSRLTTKRVSNNKYPKMSFAIARAGVTRMQMTVILNSEFSGCENCSQPAVNFLQTSCAHRDIREALV